MSRDGRLTRDALQRDVAGRIERIQRMMRDMDLVALIIFGNGAADQLGPVRYVSNARAWGGAAHAVIGLDDPDPWVAIASPYQAVWTRNETTTAPGRVESPDDIVERVGQIASAHASNSRRRVGTVNMDTTLPYRTRERFSAALSRVEIIDVTDRFNALRQIKTAFEIDALRQNGEILDAAMDVFREHASVGARYQDACAATEAFIKARGAFWGRTKMSLDLSPYTVPPPLDRTMRGDDIINFEIVYESPWGYWTEMTAIFSFHDLPDEAAALLSAYLIAFERSAAVASSGSSFRDIAEENDLTFASLGFTIAGKHTPDCHSIGIDGIDSPSSFDDLDFVVKPDMVLSFHPGTILEGHRGFLISDNVLVTDEGAVRLSPHTAERYHLRLQP
jgi:Xaa-Pro aminopeptidase